MAVDVAPYMMRKSPQPTIRLPIACRSVGRHAIAPGWHNRPTLKPVLELFWCSRGKGIFSLLGEQLPLEADQVLVLQPGRVHDLRAITRWEFCWLTLDGEIPEQVVGSFGLDEMPFTAGPCPEQLFARLSHEIEDNTPQGQLAASATSYEILTLAHSYRPLPESSRVNQCIELIRKHYASPEVNVSWLARRLNIHRTNLSKLFYERTQVSPIEYLTLFRIGKAMKMLHDTDLPIARIARQTGFSCPSYFANVIRKHTGQSPIEVRGSRVQAAEALVDDEADALTEG